jgi:hypothetical protein
VTVAVLSLGAAVLFNALAVRDSAEQAELARQGTELDTLFQIEQSVRRSSRIIFSPEFQELTARDLEGNNASNPRRRFVEAVNDVDYVAFLFNQRYLTIQGARDRWQNQLNCVWTLAVRAMPITAPSFWSDLRAATRHGTCDGPGGKFEVDDAEADARRLREELQRAGY